MVYNENFIKWEKDNIENKDSLLLKTLRENSFISVVGFRDSRYTMDLYQGKINPNSFTKSTKEATPTYRVVIEFLNQYGFPVSFDYMSCVGISLFYNNVIKSIKHIHYTKDITPAILDMLGLTPVAEITNEEKVKLMGEELF